MEAGEGAAGGGAEKEGGEVDWLAAAEEEGSPSGITEDVEGAAGGREQVWKGFPLSSASSERGSVKADGGRGSGQDNTESSLALKSIVWSEDTDTRVSSPLPQGGGVKETTRP